MENVNLSIKEKVETAMQTAPNSGEMSEKTGKALVMFAWFWTLSLLLAVPFACLVSGEGLAVFDNFRILLTSPARLITDYFELGSPGATFLNAGLCGLACNLLVLVFRGKPSATLLGGYFLVISHCFFGLNLLNMWAPILGVFVFCLVFRERFGNMLHLAMFSTSLGPFISELLFRYTLGDAFVAFEPKVTWLGALLALLFGLVSGFLVPALLPGTTAMHRGHNLYKAGLAIGLFGMFAFALLFKTMGITPPSEPLSRVNPNYTANGKDLILFVNLFFTFVFGTSLLVGFFGNGKSFRGYRALWRCDGWQDDFTVKFGMPLTLINAGIYGFFILALIDVTAIFSTEIGYTGPSVGVTIAAVTFLASGQTPRTVWPIALGYALFFGTTGAIGALAGISVLWTVSLQGYVNGFAFATGLCPFSGRYGWRVGVIAGILHAILCTSSAAMHGGFVLYTSGLTSGLTALLLLPILDFFRVKTKDVSPLE